MNVGNNRKNPRYPVRSLSKAIRILEALAEEGTPVGVTRLSDNLGWGVSAVHRYLSTLEHHGLVKQNPETSKYTLGMRLVELGASAIRSLGFGERIRPYLEKLASQTGETINLGVLRERWALFIDKVESQEFLRTVTYVGALVPLHCTALGKVLLAYLPQSERKRLLDGYLLTKYTPNTIVDRHTLEECLTQIRSHGYAVDNEEYIPGVCCVAVPVLAGNGQVVAAVSVSGPAVRLVAERIQTIVPLMQETARLISREIAGMDLSR